MRRIFRLNSPEWAWILGGSIASFLAGAVQPTFAVMLSEIIGVSGQGCTNLIVNGQPQENAFAIEPCELMSSSISPQDIHVGHQEITQYTPVIALCSNNTLLRSEEVCLLLMHVSHRSRTSNTNSKV